MKNTLKKITSLVLAVMLVFALASCGCDNSSEENADEEKKVAYENSPEGVVKRVINAQNNYDYVTLEKYYENGEDYEDKAEDGVKDLKTYYDYCIEEGYYEDEEDAMGEKGFKAYIESKIEIQKAYNKRCKVEIDKVNEDDNEAEVKFTYYYPETKMSEYELVEKAAKNLDLLDAFEDEELSEDDWKKLIKEWEKLALEQVDDADLEDSDGEIKVVKKDDKWIIAEDQ